MVALTEWATVARFETHQGSLCPPSKCREARTGLDAVILLSQQKVVFDDALISRPKKSSLLSILTVVTYIYNSGIFLLPGRARVKISGAGQGGKAGSKIRGNGETFPGQGRFCQCFGAGQH